MRIDKGDDVPKQGEQLADVRQCLEPTKAAPKEMKMQEYAEKDHRYAEAHRFLALKCNANLNVLYCYGYRTSNRKENRNNKPAEPFVQKRWFRNT